MGAIQPELDHAIRWMLYSGIINNDPNNRETYGGVNAYYDIGAKGYPFVYTEITGYAVSLLIYLSKHFGENAFIEKAQASVNWLIDFMRYEGEDDNAMGSFSWAYDFRGKRKKTYSFDCGICARALIDLYKITGDKRCLSQAQQTLSWLVKKMQNEDGSLKPSYDWSQKKSLSNPSIWYENPGCLHAKMAIPLALGSEVLNDPTFINSAKSLIQWALKLQRSSGRLIVNTHDKRTNVHAHCYALEGIIYLYNFLKEGDELLNSFIQGANWLLTAEKNGRLNEWSDVGFLESNLQTTYVASQAIRIWLIAHRLTGDKQFMNAADRALTYVLSTQCNADNSRIRGGFYEGYKKTGPFTRRINQINSWATIFAIQALIMHQKYLDYNTEQLISDVI